MDGVILPFFRQMDWLTIPSDLVFLVLEFLPISSLLDITSLCKRWKEFGRHPRAWNRGLYFARPAPGSTLSELLSELHTVRLASHPLRHVSHLILSDYSYDDSEGPAIIDLSPFTQLRSIASHSVKTQFLFPPDSEASDPSSARGIHQSLEAVELVVDVESFPTRVQQVPSSIQHLHVTIDVTESPTEFTVVSPPSISLSVISRFPSLRSLRLESSKGDIPRDGAPLIRLLFDSLYDGQENMSLEVVQLRLFQTSQFNFDWTSNLLGLVSMELMYIYPIQPPSKSSLLIPILPRLNSIGLSPSKSGLTLKASLSTKHISPMASQATVAVKEMHAFTGEYWSKPIPRVEWFPASLGTLGNGQNHYLKWTPIKRGYGDGVTLSKWLDMIRWKAENGDLDSQLFLVFQHYRPATPKERFPWIQAAANQGSLIALQNLLSIRHGSMADYKAFKDRAEYSKLLRHLAEDRNDVIGQYHLGLAYLRGEDGYPKDEPTAFRWMSVAAKAGFPSAEHNLGVFYDQGIGVVKNPVEAAHWYRIAAEHGDAPGQFMWAGCLQYGYGVSIDIKEAVRFYRMSAENGHLEGMARLGRCYDSGFGVGEDLSKAVHWWTLAADKGEKDALFDLSQCYLYGDGVEQDAECAVRLLTRAHEAGNESAQSELIRLKRQNPKLVREWPDVSRSKTRKRLKAKK